MLTLKNGTRHPEALVNFISTSFNKLAQRNPEAAYELVMKSRDHSHKFSGDIDDLLKKAALVEQNGSIRQEVIDVVLSSSEGKGSDMAFTSPFVAEEQEVRPETPEVPQNEEDLQAYFATVFALGHHIVDVMRENGVDVFDVRLDTESPNPFYDRVSANGGVALRYSYGLPDSFMTPLGKLEITGGCSSYADERETVTKVLKEHLGLEEAIPVKQDQSGVHGPIYYITKDLDGNGLPKVDLDGKSVELMANDTGYDDYETLINLWEKVKPKPAQEGGSYFDLFDGPGSF